MVRNAEGGIRAHRIRAGLLATSLGLAVVAVLAGCVDNPDPGADPPSQTPIAGSSSTPVPTSTGAPTIDLKGTAADNLAFFNAWGRAKVGKHPNIKGKTIIDELVDLGYDKKSMEITPDKTSIGLDAWNIEYSIKLKDTCLIGQAGNVGFNAFVAPPVSTGKCLIGTTRKIDW